MFDYLSYSNVVPVAAEVFDDLSAPLILFVGLGLFIIIADAIIGFIMRHRNADGGGRGGGTTYGNNSGDVKAEGYGWSELEAHARKYNDWDG